MSVTGHGLPSSARMWTRGRAGYLAQLRSGDPAAGISGRRLGYEWIEEGRKVIR